MTSIATIDGVTKRYGDVVALHDVSLASRVVVIDRGAIVADGTPGEIKARSATKVIRCRTALTEIQLSALPGIRSARCTGDRAELLATAAEPAVRDLLARDATVSDLEVVGAGLEDAFLALTAPRASAA